MKRFVFSFSLLVSLVAHGESEKPNIVFVLADDIGLGDISHYVRNIQSKKPAVETPTLDALAKKGLWFSDGHSSTALCAPTRYCVMSGNNNYRAYTSWGVWSTFGKTSFVKGEATLGSVAQEAGYQTGFVGKWHLGGDFKETGSDKIYRGAKNGNIIDRVDMRQMLGGGAASCGFDYGLVVPCGVQGPVYTMYENGKWLPFSSDSKLVHFDKELAIHPEDLDSKGPGPGDSKWEAQKLGKIISSKAVDFINKSSGENPFLLYYCSHAVHTPHVAPAEFDGTKVAGTTPSPHLDMVKELDLQVKRIVDALKANGELDKTLFIFSSDNGGLGDRIAGKVGHSSSGGFAKGKGNPEEGGHRVPFFMVWPGVISPGVSDAEVITQDVIATVAAIVGTKIPQDQAMDSLNLLPLLKGSPDFKPRQYMIQQAGARREVFFRKKPWKLIMNGKGKSPKYEPMKLYNLETNLYEKESENLVDSPEHKDIVKRLRDEYIKIRKSGQRTAPLQAAR